MSRPDHRAFVVLLVFLGAALAWLTPRATPAAVEWSVEGRWTDACSCAIPCPCWKKEVPTLGHCSEMFFFHIDKGHYGATKLDGIDVVQIASSAEGKSTSQSRKDRDYQLSNLYISKSLSPEQATAVESIFTRLAFSGPIAKKSATKRVDVQAKVSDDRCKVEIPGILTADVKAQKLGDGRPAPFPYNTTAVYPYLGPGTQAESVVFEFHDDGLSWKLSGRNGNFANFSYSSDRGPLPWEQPAK